MPLVYSAPLPTDHTSTVAVLSLPSRSLPQGLCPCCSAQCMAFSHGIGNPGSHISFLSLPDSLPQSPYLHWSPGTPLPPCVSPTLLTADRFSHHSPTGSYLPVTPHIPGSRALPEAIYPASHAPAPTVTVGVQHIISK